MSNIQLKGKSPLDIGALDPKQQDSFVTALNTLGTKSWTTLHKKIKEHEDEAKSIKSVKDVLKLATINLRGDATEETFKSKALSDGTFFQLNKDTVKDTVNIPDEMMTDDFIAKYAIKSSAVSTIDYDAIIKWLVEVDRQDIIDHFTKVSYTEWDIELLKKDKVDVVEEKVTTGSFKIIHGSDVKE